MLSGCGGVCATLKSLDDDVNDMKHVRYSAPSGLKSAVHSLRTFFSMAATEIFSDFYSCLDAADDAEKEVADVCVKTKIVEGVRCLALAPELNFAHAVQPYRVTQHALSRQPLCFSKACAAYPRCPLECCLSQLAATRPSGTVKVRFRERKGSRQEGRNQRR